MSLLNLIKFGLLFWVMIPGFVSAKTLKFEDKTWEVIPEFGNFITTPSIRSDADILAVAKNSLLGSPMLTTQRILSPKTAEEVNEIAKTLKQDPQDAKLVIEEGKAKEFQPSLNGQGLDIYSTAQLLASNDSEIILPVLISTPKITLAQTNNLGINELVAVGESDFTGSPKNRIHNIIAGAEKFNGLIIKQGEEFSFNNYLGEVDDAHGFLPELVIKRSGVIPEFGGGLCQVSSTAFRAAMNSGFEITERRNHSFAVQYYAPQGTDATIYPGATDMKFINDLPSAMLIHTKIVGKKLYYEFYGTKDDRKVVLEKPVQYDRKPDGSMKATWVKHVTKNNETKTQTFNSKYLPPALFQPPPAPTPPPTTPETLVPPAPPTT